MPTAEGTKWGGGVIRGFFIELWPTLAGARPRNGEGLMGLQTRRFVARTDIESERANEIAQHHEAREASLSTKWAQLWVN